MGLAMGLVITLVALCVLIPIGVLITNNLYNTLITGMQQNSAAYNATKDLYNNIWSAYNLSSVIPLIAAAAAIIGIVVTAFYFRSGGE